jgi:hypothetical protein
MKSLVFTATMDDVMYRVANYPGASSLIFNDVPDMDSPTAGCIIYLHAKSGNMHHTLFQMSSERDMGKIARKYGGGGYLGVSSINHEDIIFNDIIFDGDVSSDIAGELMDLVIESPVQVQQYIRTYMYPKRYQMFYGKMFGVNTVFVNNPIVTNDNYFVHEGVSGVSVGSSIVLCGNGLIRVLSIAIGEHELDDKYGEPIGHGWRQQFITIDTLLEHTIFNNSKINLFPRLKHTIV